MEIFICTYGRADRQVTYHELPPDIQARTKLIVQQREASLYPNYKHFVLPDHIRDIGKTRQWVQDLNDGPCVQLDDDLVFATRRDDDRTKFAPGPSTYADLYEMFATMHLMLMDYAHVGICAREGGNRSTTATSMNTRMMRVLGYNRSVLRKHHIRHDRLPELEDFDVTLELLKLGYPNLILNDWVHNQSGSNTSGGCSSYRTVESHNENVEKFAALHPGLVAVVQKDNLGEWGQRKDVRIQWKKAFNERSDTDVGSPT